MVEIADILELKYKTDSELLCHSLVRPSGSVQQIINLEIKVFVWSLKLGNAEPGYYLDGRLFKWWLSATTKSWNRVYLIGPFYTSCWLCVDAALAIGQCRLGPCTEVSTTLGTAPEKYDKLGWELCWPSYVTLCGSAERYKKKQTDFRACSIFFITKERGYFERKSW